MTQPLKSTDYLTISAAAENLGTTATKILMLLKSGELKGKEINEEWFVEPDSLACCKEHGIDMKTTKGCESYCSSGGCGCK